MQIKTFLIPQNHEYIYRLKFSLEKINIKTAILKPFHYSSLINIAKILFLRTKGYRIIHVHWLWIFPFGLIMKWFYYFCKTLNIKIVWEIHNILPHDYKEADIRNSKWFYEKSDAIIFHSEIDIQKSKEILKTNMEKKHIVIPHGNFNESYINKITKKEARKKLEIPENKRIILCFGSLRKNRGYEYLIEATREMQNTVVIIAGMIDDKKIYKKLDYYEKTISNLRIVAKYIPDDELQIYFNACDIVVTPYTEITTSGVIPLAYAFSRPVVTTDIGGLKDIVNEKIGILVPPNNAEALRKGIEQLFRMDIEEMGRYAYDYGDKEFNWELNAHKVRKLYELILH